MVHDSNFGGSAQDGLLWALDDAPTHPPAAGGAGVAAPGRVEADTDIFGAGVQPQPHPSAVDVDDIFGGAPRPSRHVAAAPSRHPHVDLVADPDRGPDFTQSWGGSDASGGMSVPARGFVPVNTEELPSHDADASDGEASWFRDHVFGSDEPAFETATTRRTSGDGGERSGLLAWLPVKKVAGVLAAAAVVIAGVVYIPGMVAASPTPDADPTPPPVSATPPPEQTAAPEPSVPAVPAPKVWEGGSVPGYMTAPLWTLEVGEQTARGMTRLGPVLVRPGALALHDIVTGAQVFEAETSEAVVKTFAASAVSGGAATLFWVTAPGVDDVGETAPGRLWWNSGSGPASVAMPDGCDVSAAGTQPLVTCEDGSVWWLQPDGGLGKIAVGDGQVALGVIDGAVVVVDGEGVLVVELSSGAVARFSPDVPDGDGAALVPLQWLGMGAAGVVSVWGDPAAGMGGVVDVVLHSLSGEVSGQVSVPGSLVEASQFGRGVGGARGFVGPVVVDLTGRVSDGDAVRVLPDGCTAFDAAGVVTRVDCADGEGVDVGGQVWIGASGVAATSADGGWAVVTDEAGVMSGHARIG